MRIAIVGYGSLIWDLDNLAPFIKGSWSLGTGPKMPVEFSRISPKRKNALVLVIDHTLKHDCATNVIESNRCDLNQAVEDLAARERCGIEMVGYVDKGDASYKAFPAVELWLKNSSFDGVVWTALPANYRLETGGDFNHLSARDYIKTLSLEQLAEAWRYIEYAPEVTDTPFRRFLKQDTFWQSLDFSEAAQ